MIISVDDEVKGNSTMSVTSSDMVDLQVDVTERLTKLE